MTDQEHFKLFAELVKKNIQKYGYNAKDKIASKARQKESAGKLFKLEQEFKAALIRHPQGKKIFDRFIYFICEEKKNILDARPYFRERKDAFQNGIVPALQERQWRQLLKFRINYQFVKFVMNSFEWKPNSNISKLFKQMSVIRTELIETNLPMAISRARIFWSKTPKAQLTFMDFVQLAGEGIIVAIDKYEPPYTDIFMSVIIQRINGLHIENAVQAAQMLHFYPTDRRKIYNANKFLSRHPDGGYTMDELVDTINLVLLKGKHTNQQEICDLIYAANVIGLDTKIPGAKTIAVSIAKDAAPEDDRPDIAFENSEALDKIKFSVSKLPYLNQKILRMKGIR